MDITDKVKNRETQRGETMRILNSQTDSTIALKEISPIRKDLEQMVRENGFLWASLYVFSLGKIYGIRQERARRAKRHE